MRGICDENACHLRVCEKWQTAHVATPANHPRSWCGCPRLNKQQRITIPSQHRHIFTWCCMLSLSRSAARLLSHSSQFAQCRHFRHIHVGSRSVVLSSCPDVVMHGHHRSSGWVGFGGSVPRAFSTFARELSRATTGASNRATGTCFASFPVRI